MDELLRLLKENALEPPENLARLLDLPVEDVRHRIREYEKRGVIRGYQAIVNEDQLDLERVKAFIEVKVTPEREGGFDRVARRISRFSEVQAAYLTSGAFDLLLLVVGRDLRAVAAFVSEKLSTMQGVTATATHFMLKAYKEHNLVMEPEDEHERLKVSP